MATGTSIRQILVLLLLCATGVVVGGSASQQVVLQADRARRDDLCPQAAALTPTRGSKPFDVKLRKLYEQEKFRLEAFELLGKALRVP